MTDNDRELYERGDAKAIIACLPLSNWSTFNIGKLNAYVSIDERGSLSISVEDETGYYIGWLVIDKENIGVVGGDVAPGHG